MPTDECMVLMQSVFGVLYNRVALSGRGGKYSLFSLLRECALIKLFCYTNGSLGPQVKINVVKIYFLLNRRRPT